MEPPTAPYGRTWALADGRRVGLADFITDFGQALREEIIYRQKNSLRLAYLASSHKTLLEPQGKAPHLGMLGYAQRLLPLTDRIARCPRPIRILDAGCGYGTESILFALLGAEVTAVELVADRAALAESRLDFYRRFFHRPLPLKFINANIFSYLKRAPAFDVIWAMESISHIHPAEEFLKMARRRLGPGGYLVVSDANTLNPRSWLGGIRLRGTVKRAPLRHFQDPDTGLPVSYAEERRFTLPGIIRNLKAADFSIYDVHMCGFMATTVLPPWLIRRPAAAYFLLTGQKMLQKAPILKYLGSIYTVTAAPRAT